MKIFSPLISFYPWAALSLLWGPNVFAAHHPSADPNFCARQVSPVASRSSKQEIQKLDKEEIAYQLIDLQAFLPTSERLGAGDNVDGHKLLSSLITLKNNIGPIIKDHGLRELFWQIQRLILPFRKTTYQITDDTLKYLQQIIYQKIDLAQEPSFSLTPAAVIASFDIWMDLIIRQHMAPIILMPLDQWQALLDAHRGKVFNLTRIWNAVIDQVEYFLTWLNLKNGQNQNLVYDQNLGKFRLIDRPSAPKHQKIVTEGQILDHLHQAYQNYLQALAKTLQDLGFTAQYVGPLAKAAIATSSSTWDAGHLDVELPKHAPPFSFQENTAIDPAHEFWRATVQGFGPQKRQARTLIIRLGDIGQAIYHNHLAQKFIQSLAPQTYLVDPEQNLIMFDPRSLWSNPLLGAAIAVRGGAALAASTNLRPRLYIFPPQPGPKLPRANPKFTDYQKLYDEAFSFAQIDLHWAVAQYLLGRLNNQVSPLTPAEKALAEKQIQLLANDLDRFTKYALRSIEIIKQRLTNGVLTKHYQAVRILPNKMMFNMTDFCCLNQQKLGATIFLQDPKFFNLWKLQKEDERIDPLITKEGIKENWQTLTAVDSGHHNALITARTLETGIKNRSYLIYFREVLLGEEEQIRYIQAQMALLDQVNKPSPHEKNPFSEPVQRPFPALNPLKTKALLRPWPPLEWR